MYTLQETSLPFYGLLIIAMYTLPTKISWRLPPLVWAPSYDLDMLTGDFIAGVTTALTVIPQGIGISSSYKLWFKIKNIARLCHGNNIYTFAGYAPLAGLPLQYGLYASIVPGFTYCLLGTTRQSLYIYLELLCFISSDRSPLHFHAPQIVKWTQPAFFFSFSLGHIVQQA